MGVYGLTRLLQRYAPESIQTISASALAGQRIAFDASCHLNKFVYGDEPHPHRAIYGFYMMARFCQINHITPIFVFDGAHRLPAKWLEHARRERGRIKVGHSLIYERARTERLQETSEILSSSSILLTDDAARRILAQLGETEDELLQATAATTAPKAEEDAENVLRREHRLEDKLSRIAMEIQQARERAANDPDKYTRTVHALSVREQQVLANLVRDRFRGAQNALKDLKITNQSMIASFEKRSIRVTQELKEECKAFLSRLGFLCLTCENHEAEAMCARLAREGYSDAIVTEDMDTLVFGDAPILRYFFARNRPIMKIDPLVARTRLELTREAFIDLCILCGTDFSETIHGVGPIRALALVRKHGCIENILQHLDPRHTPKEYFDYKLARKVFNDLPPLPDTLQTMNNTTQDEESTAAMLRQYEIDPDQVEERLGTILIQQNLLLDGWGKDPFAATQLSHL